MMGLLMLARRALLALGVLAAVTAPSLRAQPPKPYNEFATEAKKNVQDADSGIYVLDFRFRAPRLITVDIPGRGRRLCWYLWYQVINNTGEPRTFIPDFELVTIDKPHVYHDQVLPKVQEAIRRIEDPTGHLDIKNSVTIAAEPIPVSKKDAFPKTVTGVAIWDDVDPEANRYSIFVSGLSNGWSVDDKEVVRRKTLQLNFRRLGDKYYQDAREIRFVPPEEWVYRATTLVTAEGVKPPAPKGNEKEEKEEKKEKDKEKEGTSRTPFPNPPTPVKTTSTR
jgi:hypothetical protein